MDKAGTEAEEVLDAVSEKVFAAYSQSETPVKFRQSLAELAGDGETLEDVVFRLEDAPQFKDVKTKLPIERVEPGEVIPVRERGAADIMRNAIDAFKNIYHRTITAADGVEVRIRNPRYSTIVQMAQHLMFNNKTRTLDMGKAQVLPLVEKTLKNASVKLMDPVTRNRIYVMRIGESDYHMVVVRPDGDVEFQGLMRGRWKRNSITACPDGKRITRWNGKMCSGDFRVPRPRIPPLYRALSHSGVTALPELLRKEISPKGADSLIKETSAMKHRNFPMSTR